MPGFFNQHQICDHIVQSSQEVERPSPNVSSSVLTDQVLSNSFDRHPAAKRRRTAVNDEVPLNKARKAPFDMCHS